MRNPAHLHVCVPIPEGETRPGRETAANQLLTQNVVMGSVFLELERFGGTPMQLCRRQGQLPQAWLLKQRQRHSLARLTPICPHPASGNKRRNLTLALRPLLARMQLALKTAPASWPRRRFCQVRQCTARWEPQPALAHHAAKHHNIALAPRSPWWDPLSAAPPSPLPTPTVASTMQRPQRAHNHVELNSVASFGFGVCYNAH